MTLHFHRRRLAIGLGLLGLLLGGCAAPVEHLGTWSGPDAPAPETLVFQHYNDADVRTVTTDHYVIYSTIQDEALVRKLGQLMEGGYAQYQAIAPDVKPATGHMQCYIFDKRWQWADFTRRKTGPMATVYLQINRGGYTINDWYVAYYLGDGATCSVAAHEGWHQYVARHFKGRLPPFLEEGIATTFEGVQFTPDDLPRFNIAINQNRAISLRKACENKDLWPLEQLIGMHAGMVVDKSGGKIDAFYAEAWAFARFLWDGEGGKYRPALQRMLADIADGTVWDPSKTLKYRYLAWHPEGMKAVFEHYLGVPFDQINDEYDRYVHVLAYDQLAEQSEGYR